MASLNVAKLILIAETGTNPHDDAAFHCCVEENGKKLFAISSTEKGWTDAFKYFNMDSVRKSTVIEVMKCFG